MGSAATLRKWIERAVAFVEVRKGKNGLETKKGTRARRRLPGPGEGQKRKKES
jgi:hypothetical protein